MGHDGWNLGRGGGQVESTKKDFLDFFCAGGNCEQEKKELLYHDS